MSSIPPTQASLLQAAQAQQSASKAKDRERATTERSRRSEDQVELRVAGMESDAAVRKLPPNDSEEAEHEHHAQQRADSRRAKSDDTEARPRIDLQA